MTITESKGVVTLGVDLGSQDETAWVAVDYSGLETRVLAVGTDFSNVYAELIAQYGEAEGRLIAYSLLYGNNYESAEAFRASVDEIRALEEETVPYKPIHVPDTRPKWLKEQQAKSKGKTHTNKMQNYGAQRTRRTK